MRQPSPSQYKDLSELQYWIHRLEPTCIGDVVYAAGVYAWPGPLNETPANIASAEVVVDETLQQVIELGYEAKPRSADLNRYMLYTYVSTQTTFDSCLDYMDVSELCTLRSHFDCLQTEAIVYFLQALYHSMTGGALLPEEVMNLLRAFYGFEEDTEVPESDVRYSVNLFTNWRSHRTADVSRLAALFSKPGLTPALQGIAEGDRSLVG